MTTRQIYALHPTHIEHRATYVTDNGAEYAMVYNIDRDEAGPYPCHLRFRYEGFPWEQSAVPQQVQDKLIAVAYGQIRGETE